MNFGIAGTPIGPWYRLATDAIFSAVLETMFDTVD
jgi:hypothetical protein